MHGQTYIKFTCSFTVASTNCFIPILSSVAIILSVSSTSTCLALRNYRLCPQFIYGCRMNLWKNSYYFPTQHRVVFITDIKCVYCAVRTLSLTIFHDHFRNLKIVVQAAGQHPLTAKGRVRSQASPCEIWVGQSGTAIIFIQVLRL